MSRYFEHVLPLPPAFHGDTHSGRLLKIMWQGADTPVRRVAGVPPRAPRDLRRADRAAAADAAAELAARRAAGGADRRGRRADLVRVPPDARRAGPGRGATTPRSPSRPATRSATSCWSRASSGWPPRPASCARHGPGARRPVPGAQLVGAGDRALGRQLDHHADLDLRARHLAASAGAGDGRRDRQLHGLRDAS